MAWKRILIIAAAAAVAAFVGWRIFLIVRPPSAAAAARPAVGPGGPANGARRAAPVAVEVADVSRSTLRDRVVFSGVLESRSRLVITSKVAGRLERFPVRVGDQVKRGQLLAELDDEEYRQQLEQSRAEHEVASANVETARIGTDAAARDLDRVRALQNKQIASASELDGAETQAKRAQVALKVAEAQLRQKEVALATAQLRVQQTRLTAFWEDGGGPRIVAERLAEPGALLRANDPVVSLLETDPLVARLQVAEAVYPRLRLGLRAEVSAPSLPGRTFAGTLSAVAPFLDEKTGQAQAWVEIANPRRELAPGLAVRVQLEFGRLVDAVTVPAGAIVERGGEKGVFLVDAGGQRVSFVRVRPGASEGGRVQIVEPELSGRVVTLGQHLLENGGAVVLPK
jgi:RND family efflux transporter MFP subunit